MRPPARFVLDGPSLLIAVSSVSLLVSPQSQRTKWKCQMMVSAGHLSSGTLEGRRGAREESDGSHSPHPHPANEKEPEIDYRTVTVNTEQKVSDFYDIEERLGS